jgi:hypothetical protein
MLWTRQWTSGFHKERRISWPSEWLSASHLELVEAERLPLGVIFHIGNVYQWLRIVTVEVTRRACVELRRWTRWCVQSKEVFCVCVGGGGATLCILGLVIGPLVAVTIFQLRHWHARRLPCWEPHRLQPLVNASVCTGKFTFFATPDSWCCVWAETKVMTAKVAVARATQLV